MSQAAFDSGCAIERRARARYTSVVSGAYLPHVAQHEQAREAASRLPRRHDSEPDDVVPPIREEAARFHRPRARKGNQRAARLDLLRTRTIRWSPAIVASSPRARPIEAASAARSRATCADHLPDNAA
jgi:hypothetical protein